MDSTRALSRPWRGHTRALYVPRDSVTDAAVRDGTLRLRSAGADVRVPLAGADPHAPVCRRTIRISGIAAACVTTQNATSPPAEMFTRTPITTLPSTHAVP